MEQYRARQLTYTGVDFMGLGRSTTAVTTVNFPRTGTATYRLDLTIPTAVTWTLTATPLNRQLAMNDGQLAINSLGQQCWNPSSNTSCDLTNTSLAWSVTR